MAYALRYYKEIPQEDGSIIRLEIHKKDSTTAALEIGGVLRGLTLELQGQQDEIDSPIVKTSLSMSFVDASDIQNDKKNGFWQEFYTPDALLWRVILKAKNAQETAFRTIWGGYVTPDSYSETLNYRGSVTIIARDNIGHLQDFPFDAQGDEDGMISLFDLVSAGWAKIQSPMDLSWNGLDWLSCNDVIAYHTLMNVEHFKDMDWYTAIEEALASYGGVMRYVGGNEVIVTTLRKLPHYGGNIDKLPRIDPVFVTGATRELIPAAKRIEESASYDLQDAVQPLVKISDFSGNVHDASMGGFTAPVWSLTNQSKSGWSNTIPANAMYFNASAYEIQEIPFLPAFEISKKEIQESMWLLCDGENVRAEYSRVVNPVDLSIKLQLGETISLYGGVPTGQDLFIVNAPVKVYRIKYAIAVESDGITSYLDAEGKWSATLTELEAYDSGNDIRSLEVQVPMSEYGHNVILTLIVTGIETSGGGLEETYIQVQSLAFGLAETKAYCEKNVVNTNYAQENNVTLFRDPKIAPALNVVALPAFIKNGIFYRNGDEILPARLWSWGGSEQQMAVWNHLQLLCYYAKPNNLISGTIVNADITRVAAIYKWNHAEHILVSGRYNFLNGHIEGAVLREFARYEDMWSEVAGAAMPETEQDSRSNVEGGASSSASPSTYTATQNVNIGTGGGGGTGASNLNDLQDVDVTGVVAQSVLYYNGTSWVDMSFASLVNPLLNPYLKADVAETTYAKKDALSGLETAISANTTAITGLGTRMTNAENEIALRYTKQETNNLLAKYLLLESANQTIKGNITIEGNLIVKGDTSSTARGTDSGTDGTLIGVVVNGTRYEDETNGMLDLSSLMNQYALATEIPSLDGYAKLTDIPATMAWTAITAKPSFASVATSGSYNDLSNKPTIPTTLPASDVYAWAKASTKPSYTTTEVTEGTNLYFTNARAISACSGSYLASSLLGNNTLIHSGNISNYTAGSAYGIKTNEISNVNDAVLNSFFRAGFQASNRPDGNSNYASGLTFYNDTLGYTYQLAFSTANALYSRRKGANGWESWKTIAFTDSNVASATKLQTARSIWGQSFDGTGNIDGHMTLSTGFDAGGVNMFVVSDKAYIGSRWFNSVWRGTTHEFEVNGFNAISIADNGNVGIGTSSPAYNLHLYSSSSSAGALFVMEKNGAYDTRLELNNTVDKFRFIQQSTGNAYISLNGNHSLVFETSNTGRMCITGGGNVLIGTTDDSGYKLDVNGDISIAKGYSLRNGNHALIGRNSGDNVEINAGATARDSITTIYGTYIGFSPNRGETTALSIAPNGAVTMSSTLSVNDALTSKYITFPSVSHNATFNVNTGNGRIGCFDFPNSVTVQIGGKGKTATDKEFCFRVLNNAWNKDLFHVGNSGKVGIGGIENPQAELHVAGNAIITGDTSTGSDIRFKDKLSDHRIALSDIAEAPLFTFKWNDREDDSVHLGSSAQYWEGVAPWLVKGEDFKTLDYSTLGVAIGISLANKAVNHEERIKILEKENKALKEQIRRIQYGS